MQSITKQKKHPFANALKKLERSGMRKGIEKGIKKGMEKGRIETVIKMINEKYNDEQIMTITGLSLNQIQKLRTENPAD